MALVSQSIGRAIVTPSALAAPTTSETITAPTPNGTFLQVVFGATPCVVTLTRYVTEPSGTARANEVTASLSSTERWFPITSDFINPATGNGLVAFSSVATTTARLWKFA
jgi:hypothetical protein